MRKSEVSSTSNKSTLKDGTPRKRILRACSACRLHKARCDGGKICETCRRYGRACNYDIPVVDHPYPARKIRALEDSLVKAKHHIEDLQRQLAEDIAGHTHQASSSQGAIDASQDLQTPGEIRHGTARSTGLDLIEVLLRPLSQHDDIRGLTRSKGSGEFLRNSPSEIKPFFTGLCQLPAHTAMIGAVRAAFEGIFGLCNVVAQQDFNTAAQTLYDTHPMSYTQEDADFMPLFFGVIALGMILRTGFQQKAEPEDDLEESQFYFAAASAFVNPIEEHLSLPKLQAGLSMVLYLVNTSKPDLARRQIHAIASSSIVQNFLFDKKRDETYTQPSDTLLLPTQLIWLICYLDMHVSGLLGLNPLLDSSISTCTTTPTINTAARNVTVSKRSDGGFLFEVSLAMAVELERLIHSSRTEIFADVHESLTLVKKEAAPEEEVPEFSNSAHIDFATWERTFQSIFSVDDNNPLIALAQNELRMHYYLAQIVLLHGHLVHHSRSPDTNDPDRLEHICKGRACVIAASNAILFIAERAERMQMTSLTWLSAYTVFVSAIALMTAIAILDGTNTITRDAMERTIQIAFHILKYTTYNASQGRSTYLKFLAVVASRLNIKLEHGPADDIAMSTDMSSYGSESGQHGSSTASNDTPPMITDTGAISSFSGRWEQWPKTEPQPEEWGFD